MRHSRNQKGFSLIEVLIAVGILGFISLVVADIFSKQTKGLKAMDEKMSIQNLQTQILNVLTSEDYCRCWLNGVTYNPTSQQWTGFPNNIQSSYNSGTCAGSGGAILRLNEKIPSTNVIPDAMTIQLTEVLPGSGNGEFSGNLSIHFNAAEMQIARKNATIPMFFRFNMAGGANKAIISCNSVVGGAGGGLDMNTICTQIGGVWNENDTPPCKPTYQ